MNTYYEKMDSVEKQTKRRSIESESESKLKLNTTADLVIRDEAGIPSHLEQRSRRVRQISQGMVKVRLNKSLE